MAFADVTDGSRIILQGINPIALVMGAAVLPGDLVTEAGALADGNATTPVPAQYIAGHKGASGDTVICYRTAIIKGVSGATKGNPIYLSDTAGGYTETASTTQRQRVGYAAAADMMVIEPERMINRYTVCLNVAAAQVIDTVAAAQMYRATQRVRVTKISESHAVVSTGAATGSIERLQGTEANGAQAGDDLLGATKMDLNGVIANTVQSPALTGTAAHLVLEIGDRLAIKLGAASGATTGLIGSIWAVELEPA